MGHRDVSTTMIYLHVLDDEVGVRSPLDLPVGVLSAAGLFDSGEAVGREGGKGGDGRRRPRRRE